jgi:hypothetical protein
MKKKLINKFLVFFVMAGLLAVGMVSATTTSDAIKGAADRLISLQNTDGGWDWIITNAIVPGGSTAENIVGVTGKGLLDAYSLTGDSKYIDSAKKAGNYLKTHFGLPGTIDVSKRVNAFDIVFLYNLGQISGDSSYTDAANSLLNNVLTQNNYWAHNLGSYCSSSTGCTAQNMYDAINNRRGGDMGIMLWDLSPWVEAANLGGKTSWANDLKTIMNNHYSSLDNTKDTYIIGLSGLILATGKSEAITALISNQDSDGSWDGWIQDTAYAIMALKKAGDTSGAVDKAGSYLVSHFGYTGTSGTITGWEEPDTPVVEYSEVTSEAAQALYDVFSDLNQEVDGDLAGWFWSISVTPSVLKFGPIPRGGSITDSADSPIVISTTGDTKDDKTYVYASVTGIDSSFYNALLELLEGNSGTNWKDVTSVGVMTIPEEGSKTYGARLHGSTLNILPGKKAATIVYTAYGEPLTG